jgi:hypothetical protein
MNGVRIEVISILLLMLLMSISAVTCQNASSQNVSDQKVIDDLNSMRLRLLTILDATIPEKDHFDKTGSVQNTVNIAAGKIITYKDKNGRVLVEMIDNRDELLNDTFQDPSTNLVLDTEYAAYKWPLCCTLVDTKNQEQLKVCYRCNDSQVWQNQTVWDLKTGNILTVKQNCCCDITESALQKRPGLPPKAVDPSSLISSSPLTPFATYCTITGQFEVP